MAVYFDHHVGARFARKFPALDMHRGCEECRGIVAAMDSAGLAVDISMAAKQIVRNANRHALKEFGATRSEQTKAVASEIEKVVAEAKASVPSPKKLVGDHLTFRSTDAHSDVTLTTIHYNPCKYRRLRETYYEWLPTLPQKPICYELVFDDDEPEIEGSVVVRGTRSRNLMWQKEPLCNLLLTNCTTPYFVWSDHDMIWQDTNWLSNAIGLLDDRTHAVQLFRRFIRPEQSGEKKITNGTTSGGSAPGGAWLAKTDWLRKLGGFPVHKIVGGGDTDIYRKMKRHATCLDSDVIHLWHGDKKHRQHHTRMDILRRRRYKHGKDTRINENGILEWCSDKPDLHREVREFFEGRKEDG
ncbi:hypothetical protein [Kordiimonas sp.]|uniref:hypothetical protein n=1 Tax=Kordiimonas sp. TaxID=1970157 RepID=UPI003A901E22